jgi:hypothetical protein
MKNLVIYRHALLHFSYISVLLACSHLVMKVAFNLCKDLVLNLSFELFFILYREIF